MKHWSAGETLLLALGLLLAAQCSRSRCGALAILAIASFIALVIAKVTLLRWMKMLCAPAGFLSTGLIVAPITWSRGLCYDAGLFNKVCDASTRSLACVSCALLLLCARSPVEWAAAAPRDGSLRFLADLMILTERHFHTLRATATAIRTAQQMRLGEMNFRCRLRSFSLLCASLLQRSARKAESLQAALDLRGYDETLLVQDRARPIHALRIAGIVFLIALAWTTGRLL